MSNLPSCCVVDPQTCLDTSEGTNVYKTTQAERVIIPYNRTSKYNQGKERIANREVGEI